MEEARTEFSARAQGLLREPRFHSIAPASSHGERQYADGKLLWWSGAPVCEGWGYQGPWSDGSRVLLEAAGVLLKGQNWGRLKELGARELEFFLRDRNSVVAVSDEAMAAFSEEWPDIQSTIAQWLQSGVSLVPYRYSRSTPFGALSVTDKIQEIKAFLLSDKLAPFYQRGGRIELLDVEDCTLYIALETGDIPQGAFLDWLQIIAAESFQEPSLNLIPEPFPTGGLKKNI